MLMKIFEKKSLSLLLSVLMVCIALWSAFPLAEAQAEVSGLTVSAFFETEEISLYNGAYYMGSAGEYTAKYAISNETEEPFTIYQFRVSESVTGSGGNNTTRQKVSQGQTIAPGGQVILTGSQLSYAGVDGETLRYSVEVKLEENGDWQMITFMEQQLSFYQERANVTVKYLCTDRQLQGSEGTIELEVEVTSKSNVPIKNIIISDVLLGRVASFDLLDPGETRAVKKKFVVELPSPDQTVVQLIPQLEYETLCGQSISDTLESAGLQLNFMDDSSYAQFEVTPAKFYLGKDGGEVSFQLVLKNTSKSRLRDVMIQLPFYIKVDDSYVNQLHYDSLEPDETVELSFAANCVPENEYIFYCNAMIANAAETVSQRVTIVFESFSPEISVSVSTDKEDYAYGESVSVEYIIKNVGNYTLEDVMLTDSIFEEPRSVGSLDPGQEKRLVKIYTIKDVMQLKATAKGTAFDSQGDAHEVSADSESLTIEPTTQYNIKLYAKCDENTVNPGDKAAFVVTVLNSGTAPVSGFVLNAIVDGKTITVCSAPSKDYPDGLSAGAHLEIPAELVIDKNGNVEFELICSKSEGTQYIQRVEVELNVVEKAAQGPTVTVLQNVLMIVMFVLLAAVSLFVLLLIYLQIAKLCGWKIPKFLNKFNLLIYKKEKKNDI